MDRLNPMAPTSPSASVTDTALLWIATGEAIDAAAMRQSPRSPVTRSTKSTVYDVARLPTAWRTRTPRTASPATPLGSRLNHSPTRLWRMSVESGGIDVAP